MKEILDANIYFILEGRFELSSTGPDGEELPVAVLRRGEYMGEYGMLTGQPHNSTARAQSSFYRAWTCQNRLCSA